MYCVPYQFPDLAVGTKLLMYRVLGEIGEVDRGGPLEFILSWIIWNINRIVIRGTLEGGCRGVVSCPQRGWLSKATALKTFTAPHSSLELWDRAR